MSACFYASKQLRKGLAPMVLTATTALTAMATKVLSKAVPVIIPALIATMGPMAVIAVMVSTLTAPKLRGMGALARTRRASDRWQQLWPANPDATSCPGGRIVGG